MDLEYPDADGTIKGLLYSVNRSAQKTATDGRSQTVDATNPPAHVSPSLPITKKDVSRQIASNAKKPPPSSSSSSSQRSSDTTENPKRSRPRPPTPAAEPRSQRENRASTHKRRRTNPSPESQKETGDSSMSSDDWTGSSPYRSGDRWRDIVRTLVEADHEADDETLLEGIAGIRQIVQHIAHANKPTPPKPLKPNFQIVHRVTCEAMGLTRRDLYLGQPYPQNLHSIRRHLVGADLIGNFDLFVERSQATSFIVFRNYFCCSDKQQPENDGLPEPSTETLVVLSPNLLKILESVKEACGEAARLFPDLQMRVELERPHIWTYWTLQYFENWEKWPELEEDIQHIQLFLRYFREGKREEHNMIRNLSERRLMTAKLLEYMFIPGRLLLRRDSRGAAYEEACIQKNWPVASYKWSVKETSITIQGTNMDKKLEIQCKVVFKFDVLSWDFGRVFENILKAQTIEHSFCAFEPSVISEFPLYPLDYAESDRILELRKRGTIYWQCRRQRYVEYSGLDFEGRRYQPRSRFMIDNNEFKNTVPNTDAPRDQIVGRLDPGLEQQTPPEGYFVLLLPSHIWGFHMQNKSWRPLLVSNITDVTWDQNVFNTLVLPNDTKDLVMALIMNKIDTEQSTDFVHEKGTGLVILFHGPPGTGKTMTAESVAELARKPLYRVTCGDIGTKPEDVERYLKRVLWLGKTWDCVVLLDEAEVFLQERALNDVQRNALVSIFLRTLEYYDGILVLTSNRVGTFDEGFKSRIQLALHYENLTHSSRERVWENFINRLESFRADDIDVGDLRLHIKDLADYKMNGRQIRNAVTTGRQLAMFKKKPLDFNGMKHVIKVSGRFDDYLRSVNEGMEDEDIAREDRVR